MAFAALSTSKRPSLGPHCLVRRKPRSAARDVGLLQTYVGAVPRLNAATLPHSPTIQTKLQVGPPNDRFEQEADRVADQVMRMADPQRPGTIDLVGEAPPDGVQRVCAECAEEVGRQPAEDEAGRLQMKRAPGATPDIPPGVQAQIGGLRGGGQPLTSALRAFFEPRFGHDFSEVHVHQGREASETARQLGARAYTLGHDVVFGQGEYRPQSDWAGG